MLIRRFLKWLLIGFFLLNIISCKQITLKLYGVNKVRHFRDKNGYKHFIAGRYIYNAKNFYYVSSCNDIHKLLYRIIPQGIDNFYGIFINDSTREVKSDYLLADQSCQGRITNEISESSINKKYEIDNLFKAYQIINESSGQRFYPLPGKKTIVMIFSEKMGRIHAKDMIKVQRRYEGNDTFQVVMLSLDCYCDMK